MDLTYQNPVWPDYFADPFILRWQNEYYAYGTTEIIDYELESETKVFPLLRSTNLVKWEQLGYAMAPLDTSSEAMASAAYWAPEVAERDGRFYMYYSACVGPGDEGHRLRIAVANHPAGPFRDTGNVLLPNENFSIDAHPFCDPRDGRWYLFFAKDYFDERVGTGTAVVPLADDMMSVVGTPILVLRAAADWQIFQRNRTIYNQSWEAWHTIEGPFVVEHDGRYYCFYSGGAWHTSAYGVSYGVADNVLGPYRDEWSAEGPSVLRGIPGKVLGPGHNSVVRGPDNQTDFLVYHAWDIAQTARRMFIDPIVWTPEGPQCNGPTCDHQTIQI
jgi:beta-xylosidase